ncbi:hypothetical protein [Kaistella faecalis]|uniref:hypothetical protein n=1 Tax=Kaistella faecalis TaxID=2852098 RepID=UPI001C444BD4|nr:hypothetical protein [Chryseobacterium faecale]UFK97971.1 hypothetical protein LL667_01120 [Chryseobacterium faecale]
MNLFKKILSITSILILLSLLSGYFYFDRKFTPDKNYLHVSNESGTVKIKWENKAKKAMLLPVHFSLDTVTYYMQFDTGSPYTMFYKNSIAGISKVATAGDHAESSFKIGNSIVQSDHFKVIDFGNKPGDNAINIIGTIGTDLLENRKTVLNFKDNYVIFNLTSEPKNFENKTFDFKFKKRKIIIPAVLEGRDEEFLYDSGTSAYQLLTNKDIWEKLKLKNSKIITEKGRSWNNLLTTYTAETEKDIIFKNTKIPLSTMTYVEGYSKSQYYLMKFSGMSGMLGNEIFLQKQIYFDAKNMKMGIE